MTNRDLIHEMSDSSLKTTFKKGLDNLKITETQAFDFLKAYEYRMRYEAATKNEDKKPNFKICGFRQEDITESLLLVKIFQIIHKDIESITTHDKDGIVKLVAKPEAIEKFASKLKGKGFNGKGFSDIINKSLNV